MTVVRRLATALPKGGALAEERWQARHRLLLVVLALHVPGLAVVASVNGLEVGDAAPELGLLIGTVAVGALVRRRLIASLAVTLGLMGSAAVLVHLTGGLAEGHFHFFVLLGLVALYHDWTTYLTAIAFILLSEGVLGRVWPEWVYGHGTDAPGPVSGVLVFGGFVLAAAVAHLLFWKISELDQERSRGYSRQLFEGQQALVSSLREAERVKAELIGVVSHELRTPLTSILGFAQTLEARVDQMDRRTMMACLHSIDRQARRLERIVANLLVTSGASPSMPERSVDLNNAVETIVAELERYPGVGTNRVVTVVEPGLGAALGPEAAAQVIGNLVENALKFASPHTEVRVSGRRVGHTAVLEVADLGVPLPEGGIDRIFEPFVQADSSDTRSAEGIGLGLSVVRRVVEAHAGRIEARNAGPWVVFVVTLPAVDAGAEMVAMAEVSAAAG